MAHKNGRKPLPVKKRGRRSPTVRRPGAGRVDLHSPRRDAVLRAIGTRMQRARLEVLKLSQAGFGYSVGRSHGRGIQDNERGLTMPSGDTLLHFFAHGVNPTWILSGHGNMRITEFDNFAAVVDFDSDTVLVTLHPKLLVRLTPHKNWHATPTLYGLPVSDQSMAPTLGAGDIAICRLLGEAERSFPEGMYVIESHGVKFVRRLSMPHAPALMLKADNHAFGSVELGPGSLKSGETKVIAEVVARYTIPM